MSCIPSSIIIYSMYTAIHGKCDVKKIVLPTLACRVNVPNFACKNENEVILVNVAIPGVIVVVGCHKSAV